MTRIEYFKSKCEEVLNQHFIPRLKNQEISEDKIKYINLQAFLYSVGRKSAFTIMLDLYDLMNEENKASIKVVLDEIWRD